MTTAIWNPQQIRRKPFSQLMCTFLMGPGSKLHLEAVSLESRSPLPRSYCLVVGIKKDNKRVFLGAQSLSL